MEEVIQKTTCGISFDGRSICRLQRQRLWEEDADLESCVETLLLCMHGTSLSEEELRKIAIEILEGKLILEGAVSYSLVEDGENIRTMEELMRRKEAKIKKYQLRENMDTVPLKYIDSYCTCYSLAGALVTGGLGYGSVHSGFNQQCGDLNREKVVKYFLYGRYGTPSSERDIEAASTYLERGTHLLNNEDWAFKILGGPCRTHQIAMEKVTNYFNQILQGCLNDGKTYETLSESERAVLERNVKYYSFNRIYDKFPFKDLEQFSRLRKKTEEENKSKVEQTKPVEFVPRVHEETEYDRLSSLRHSICYENLALGDKKDLYKPIPSDDHLTILGWVAPDGSWFSCGFGHHSGLANEILISMHSFKEESLKEDLEDFDIFYDIHIGILELLKFGYIQVQSDGRGEVFNTQTPKITKAQYNTLYEHVKKFSDLEEDFARFIDNVEVN